jgi:Arc/MetJ family transcription regulator
MNTEITIDDRLIAEALAATGLQTREGVIELGLKTLIQLEKQKKIKEFKGQLPWQGDLEKMRIESSMMLVDSSVWIDYFNSNDPPETAELDIFEPHSHRSHLD